MTELFPYNDRLTKSDIALIEQRFLEYVISVNGVRTRKGLLSILLQPPEKWIKDVSQFSAEDQDAFIVLATSGTEVIQHMKSYTTLLEKGLSRLFCGFDESGLFEKSLFEE